MYFFYKLIFLCSLATRFQGISSPSSLRKFRKFPLLGQIQLYFFVRIHAYAAFLSIYARPYTSPRGSARLQHLQKKASPAFVPERNLSTELKRAKLLTHTQRLWHTISTTRPPSYFFMFMLPDPIICPSAKT